jgi:hypothetical protein
MGMYNLENSSVYSSTRPPGESKAAYQENVDFPHLRCRPYKPATVFMANLGNFGEVGSTTSEKTPGISITPGVLPYLGARAKV